MTTIFSSRRTALEAAAVLGAAWLLAACQTSGGAGGERRLERKVSPAAQRQFEDSVRAFDEGRKLGVIDWDLMARKFQAVVKEDDLHAEAWFNLGVIAEERRKDDEAQKAYRRAIDAKPTLFMARENLGVLLERKGDTEAAAEEYKAILRASPMHAGARARLAGIFFDGGDLERAKELARESLLRDPKNTLALKILLKVHAARKEGDVARLVAMRAMQLDAKDPEIPYLLGQVLERQGDLPGAMARYRRSFELGGDFLPARARLASESLKRRNFVEAEELYSGIVRAEPESAAAHLNLGTAYFGQGKIDEAQASFEKALELDPEDARAAYSLGVIHHRHRGELQLALGHYRRFLSGSAINLPGSHPVFALMRECEQLIQLEEETRLAEEAAKLEEERRVRQELEAAAAAAEEAKAREGQEPRPAEAAPAEVQPKPAANKSAPVKEKAKPRVEEPETKIQSPSRVRSAEIDPDEPEDEF